MLYYIYSGDELLGFIYKDVTYYYDEETKLYYLNSRYYNPLWGRFISSDRIMASNENISSCNLFSYANNNFLNNIDKNGMWGEKLKRLGEKFVAGVKKKSIKKASQSNKVALTLTSSAFLLGIKKYPITSVLFNKAMWDSDSKLDDTTEKMIQNSLLESDTFREGVDSIIERNYKYNQSFTSNIETITFESGDLKYAFHNADIRVSCTWSNGYPTYLVTFSDTYDFTEYVDEPKELGEYANNLGYEMQKNGQLKPYNISMTFEYR